MKISARTEDVEATIRALKQLPKELPTAINAHTRKIGLEELQGELRGHAETRLDHRMLVDTATLRVSSQNLTMSVGGKGRPLSGGLSPKDYAAAFEFGAATEKQVEVRSSKGNRYKRHTARQMPYREPSGRVFYPAASRIIPRVVSLWVQTTVRTIHEILEGR